MANGNRSSVDFEVQPRGGRLVDYNKLFRNAVESSLLICDLARRKGHPISSTRKCWSIWEKGGRGSIRFSSLSFYAPSKGLCAILFVDGSCNEWICIKYLVQFSTRWWMRTQLRCWLSCWHSVWLCCHQHHAIMPCCCCLDRLPRPSRTVRLYRTKAANKIQNGDFVAFGSSREGPVFVLIFQ